MKAERELVSMLSLVDDPDIGKTVKEQFIQRGEEAIEAIAAIRNELPDMEDIVDSLMVELKESVVIAKLKTSLGLPEPPLNKVLFLLTKLADWECEEDIWDSILEDFMIDLSIEISADKTDIENVEIFNYLFFTRFKFEYEDSEIKREDCALINSALISKRGNPVAISLIYFLLSRGVGLPVYPLCFSRGFIPAYLDRRGEVAFCLNVFNRRYVLR